MSKRTYLAACPYCNTPHDVKIGEDSYVEFVCCKCKANLYAKTTKDGIKVSQLAPKPLPKLSQAKM